MTQEDDEKDDLPTEEQREKLGEIIAFAFIEIRLLGWAGKSAQAADLAEAFHNLPREMYGDGHFSWRITRGIMEWYQDK